MPFRAFRKRRRSSNAVQIHPRPMPPIFVPKDLRCGVFLERGGVVAASFEEGAWLPLVSAGGRGCLPVPANTARTRWHKPRAASRGEGRKHQGRHLPQGPGRAHRGGTSRGLPAASVAYCCCRHAPVHPCRRVGIFSPAAFRKGAKRAAASRLLCAIDVAHLR